MNIHVDAGNPSPSPAFPFESRVLSLLEIRKAASDEIERLIAMLDDLDGDTDLEPNLACWSPDDRDTRAKPKREQGIVFEGFGLDDVICLPCLPCPEGYEIYDEREGDDVDLEDEGDLEPALGAPELHPTTWGNWLGTSRDRSGDQTLWSDGSKDDREDEDEREDGCDAEADKADDEPCLGATEAIPQGMAWKSSDEIVDGEPDLGWTGREAAYGGYHAPRDDREREWDQAEDGIGDSDGLHCHMMEHAAATSFQDDRERRLAGRPLVIPVMTMVRLPVLEIGDRTLLGPSKARGA